MFAPVPSVMVKLAGSSVTSTGSVNVTTRRLLSRSKVTADISGGVVSKVKFPCQGPDGEPFQSLPAH